MVLDEPNADEAATSVNGVEVLVAPELHEVADGTVVDYEDSSYGTGFVVRGASDC